MKLIQGDCLEEMEKIEEGCIDLTVTSPPYDNLRTYNGNNDQWNEDVWKGVIKELYRVTKEGGVVVWVVGDATIKGSETGTSFKQALWAKECGFNLHDTMIYEKNVCPFPDTNRYYQGFEYMFILSKGKIRVFNPIKDRKNKSVGRIVSGTQREKDGTTSPKACLGNKIKEFGVRFNYWLVSDGNRNGLHPAQFPEQLAHDHITSWSNEGDTVFDPFMGSGTTGKMAKELSRDFIGIEIDKEYFEIAKNRISN